MEQGAKGEEQEALSGELGAKSKQRAVESEKRKWMVTRSNFDFKILRYGRKPLPSVALYSSLPTNWTVNGSTVLPNNYVPRL